MSDVGYVYLAIVDNNPNIVKIGKADNVQERMRQLTDAPESRGKHTAPYCRRVENPLAVEKKLHEQFNFCRESQSNEYFRVHWQAVKPALDAFPEAPQNPKSLSAAEHALLEAAKPAPLHTTETPFLYAIQNCNLTEVNRFIAEGVGLNLAETYNWSDFADAPYGQLQIGHLLALNPDALLNQQGESVIDALIVAYIRHNPGASNAMINRSLGIKSAHIDGRNRDWFGFRALNRLRDAQIVENQGEPGHPAWFVVE